MAKGPRVPKEDRQAKPGVYVHVAKDSIFVNYQDRHAKYDGHAQVPDDGSVSFKVQKGRSKTA